MVSQTFPDYHPQFGKYTWFPENINSHDKKHTIRAAKRFKPNEMVSFRVWESTPYRSPQVEFNRKVVVETYDIKMQILPYKQAWEILSTLYGDIIGEDGIESQLVIWINEQPFAFVNLPIGNFWKIKVYPINYLKLCMNDGLNPDNFFEWFKPALLKGPFEGQIICWEKVGYKGGQA